ncbi:hypothetical protein BH11MYX1_BH11MYX1_00570 [soil metagenome]
MLNLVLVWLLLTLIVLGWGLFAAWSLRRLGRGSLGGSLSTFQIAWLGYATLLGFLQLCSLVLAMNTVVIALSLAPAVAGFALQRHAIAAFARSLQARPRHLGVASAVVVTTSVVTAYAACDLVQWYDTGLYHLQAVKWAAHYPAVPGLANLHYRFGYNNSVHLFAAYTDAFWEGVAAHIANGFLLLIALCQWFTEILFARGPCARVRQVFCLFTLPFLLTKLWSMEASSLSTDLALTVVSFVLVLEVISLQPTSSARALPLALITSLGAAVLTTKLAGLALTGIVVVLVALQLRSSVTWRTRVLIFAWPAVIVFGWLARGVVESGWLLYPVFGRLPLSWSVPRSVAETDFGAIQSWARIFGKAPGEVFGHRVWHWLAPWLDSFRGSHEFVLLLAALALLAYRFANGPTGMARRAGEHAAILGCAFGLAQWFFGAPDLRYGAFLFWLLPAVLFAPMLARAIRDTNLRPLVMGFSFVVTLWAGGFAFHLDARVPRLWGRPPAPPHVLTNRATAGPGTELWVPSKGDQCFDSELPCSPVVSATLRTPGSLRGGYNP